MSELLANIVYFIYVRRSTDVEDKQVLSVEAQIVELRKFAAVAEKHDVILLHENEKDIYGDTGARCRVIFEALASPHFRAAFDTFAPPGRILEVDCPGLTTPNLKALPWTRMPRPVYPLDEDTVWSAG